MTVKPRELHKHQWAWMESESAGSGAYVCLVCNEWREEEENVE